MVPNEFKEKLLGIIGFVITPFQPDHELDLKGLELLARRIARSGAHALCCAGGVGEFYSLSLSEYEAVVQTVVGAAAGRIPVIAGVGHATRIACEWARAAAEAGADGLMINPVYFAEPSIEGLQAHYRAIADAAGLGMIAFSTSQFVYNIELMEHLTQVPELVGLKDEIGNLNTFLACKARLGDRFAWINGMAEPLVTPYFAAGARAFTTGLVNFAPEIPERVHRLAIAGDYQAVDLLVDSDVRPIATLRARRKGYSTAVIKEAASMLGLPGGPCRLPLLPLDSEDRAQLSSILSAMGLLVAN